MTGPRRSGVISQAGRGHLVQRLHQPTRQRQRRVREDPEGCREHECINKVGLPLQRAFNDYRAAGRSWIHCIQDYAGSFDKGSPALKTAQTKWAAASVAISSAQSGLDAIRP
jgi:hypothetical protein